MLDLFGEQNVLFLIGLCGGCVLGLAARVVRFCTLGMIEDVHYRGNTDRLGIWLAALGTAIIANFLAQSLGWIDLGDSRFLAGQVGLVSAVFGGLLFGYGMAHTGNCSLGLLVRIGGGDIRALVAALVMGIAAYMTLFGLLSGLREALLLADPQPFGNPVELVFATQPHLLLTLGLVAGGVLIIAALRYHSEVDRTRNLAWGMLIGIAITSGFVGTAWVAASGFGFWPVTSHSFTAPAGEMVQFTMFSGGDDLSFGLGSLVGVLIGSLAGSWFKQEFRWEACDDPRELRRQMGGAVCMGVGAVLAAGCSIGQGLSGLSTLSIVAPLVAAAIWFGCWLGLRGIMGGGYFSAAE